MSGEKRDIMSCPTLSFLNSLPRYKSSGAIKGFGFVEFATQESASKAVEVKERLHGKIKNDV